MAIHRADAPVDADLPILPDGRRPQVQFCSRCGLRLTRPYQRFPEGAAVEVKPTYTTILLNGVPDCGRRT
jgi:hypothetical protein